SVGRENNVDLKVRVGVATGLVVVGDVVAGDVTERDAVAGEAANLAARLQGLASPNSILVSSLTSQLPPARFPYSDLGPHQLKGFESSVLIYQVLAEREISRLEARGPSLSPFVGRVREIEMLLDCWNRAASGNGRLVIIAGEAGIGKSRIAAELRSR